MINRFRNTCVLIPPVIIAAFALTVPICAQQKSDNKTSSPATKKSDQTTSQKQSDQGTMSRDQMLMQNGEKEMGFSQTATTHHFILMKDGGAIRIEVNEAADTANRDKIRLHLKGIAAQFAKGIFTTPFAIHGQVPPGVPVMDELKHEIKYTYEQTENGAQIRITTANQNALAAIYEFLKFQITEHKTGDPTAPAAADNFD